MTFDNHYGLAHHAHPAIPVCGSEGTISVLEVGCVFFPDAVLPAGLRRLTDAIAAKQTVWVHTDGEWSGAMA